MDKETFNKLMQKHDKELFIDRTNVSEKSMELPAMRNKYLDIFSKQFKILKQFKREVEEKYGQLYRHYKYFDAHKWDNKHEIESQINQDKSMVALRTKCDEQEVQVKQLEAVLDNIKGTSYAIRNIVDYERFKMTGL